MTALAAFATMKFCIFATVLAVARGLVAASRRGADQEINPVTKVVNLLKGMQDTCEADAKEDDETYAKMDCWCVTNDKEKTEAIKVAKTRIQELGAAIESGTARSAELVGVIDGLKEEMAADQDALAEMTTVHEKEKEDFEAQDADLSESSGLLKEAIAVLSKVQLAQKSKLPAHHPAAPVDVDGQALMQVRNLVKQVSGPRKTNAYFSVMRKDLWDLLSTLPGANSAPPRVITGFSQAQQPTGAAAGASSYSSRSSSIFGILSQMKETMDKDLATAHKAAITAEIGFQKLRALKEGEIEAAAKSIEEKTTELADTNAKVAQAKEDLEDTESALSADEKFLVDLKKQCATASTDYEARRKTRQEEILAIAETIKILTGDEARDLFSKQLSFVQTRASHQRQESAAVVLSTRQHAASQLLQAAKRRSGTSGGWRLALLAVSTQLDGFEKVKEMMDKMIAELKKQQGEEYEKKESCRKDIKANEDSTMVKTSEKKDLDAKIADLTGELAELTKGLEELALQVSTAHIELKRAGENRKAENHEFQQMITDQRAMIQILHKALDRMNEFYANASLLTVRARAHKQEPGAPVAPPPPAGKAYEKSGTAPGVLEFLEKIIQEAEHADKEAVAAEQESQEAYANFVANTNEALDTYEKAIAGKTEAKEKATADKLTAGQDLQATERALADLGSVNKALHLDCDYVLKNFNIRQTARQEEIEAIQEAKAILSGADFGF